MVTTHYLKRTRLRIGTLTSTINGETYDFLRNKKHYPARSTNLCCNKRKTESFQPTAYWVLNLRRYKDGAYLDNSMNTAFPQVLFRNFRLFCFENDCHFAPSQQQEKHPAFTNTCIRILCLLFTEKQYIIKAKEGILCKQNTNSSTAKR